MYRWSVPEDLSLAHARRRLAVGARSVVGVLYEPRLSVTNSIEILEGVLRAFYC